MLQKIFITLVLFVFTGWSLYAQRTELEYTQKLSISEGLAHNGVTSILHDSNGYLWISTYDGLNRYDGYDSKIYKNTLDKDLFVSNRIRTIAEDKNGNLWLGTDEGISVYNYAKEEHHNIYSNKQTGKKANGPIVRKILMNKEDKTVLCATEGDGILVFNSNFTFSKQYSAPLNNQQKPILFHDGFALDESNYVFSSNAGLVLFNLETGQFIRPFKNEIYNGKAILKVDENTILTTATRGINIYTFEKSGNSYSFKIKSQKYNNRQFSSATIDKHGNLWLGTVQRGVIHIDDAQNFINNQPVKRSFFGSESGFLRTSCFLATEDHGCWVGSFDKGLFRFDLKENPFKNYNMEPGHELGLKTNEVIHVKAYDKDRFYVSANSGGTALFNTISGQFETLPFKIDEEFNLSTVLLFIDSRKNTWLRHGANLGIAKTGEGQKTIKTISHDSFPNIATIIPRSITEDKQGNIWLGCLDDVYKITFDKNGEILNIESLNNHPFFKNKQLTLSRYVYLDPLYNFIWVGTDSDGLIRIKNKNNKTLNELEIDQYLNDKKNKRSVSSNFVSSVIRLPNSELWIGTERGGINKVVNSDKQPEFISFSEKQGLSNNVVKNILYDDEYNLWISTNIGLNKFDTKDFTFRTFGKQDGLPFDDFLYASAKLKNGNFVFAGLNGFFYFNPNQVSSEEVLPKLNIGDLTIFNKSILPGDTLGNRILFEERLKDTNELKLKHNENVFSIELTSLHYSTPENHFLKYKLLPLNEEWIEVSSSQKQIHYNGLQPGNYELHAMASNSLNEWTEPILLKIKIVPPFWITLPAFILYLFVIGLIVYSVIYYILRMNRLRHNLEIEQLEKDNVKEVNAAKLRFFSNISHEIKTPLTLISGPVNMLAERFRSNSDVQEKLKLVKRQSKKISQLVEQVHDFQRADAHQLKMNYSTFCFDDFIDELGTDFQFLAGNDKKTMEITGDKSRIYVSADKDKLEKIVNNLLNNAFKYTKSGDSIQIKYKKDKKDLQLSVSDTGKGIAAEDLPFIFERFYQSRKKSGEYISGSGIGLAFSKRLVEMHYGYIHAESSLGNGTSVYVQLPVITTGISEDQQKKEQNILSVEKGFDPGQQFSEKIDPSNIKLDGSFADASIFIAEDNSDMRTFISSVLSNFFKVSAFANGKECLNTMKEQWPDIVISDVLMPEVNGFDLCKQIKSDIKTSHIPVILLTACTTIEEQIQGLEVGADAYIKKPFNVQHLVTRTETLLRNRKKLRERFQIDFPLSLEKKEDNNNDIAFLEKLYSLMAENLDNQDLDINHFAKELYLNRTHFYQKVKALTNQTPFELLKIYRLKKAAELLAKNQYSVNEVYMMTGFKSRTHFSKLFKETYNVSPGKYVTEVLKNVSG